MKNENVQIYKTYNYKSHSHVNSYDNNNSYLIPLTCLKMIISAPHPIIRIDGWTDPNNDARFCLGSVYNGQRSREIELVRRNIGAGIELIYELGKISLKNISETSVFIQSPQMNYNWSLDPKENV